MKLAEALQLRTTITEAIARVPNPMQGRSATLARATPQAVTAIGQPKPITAVKETRIAVRDSVHEHTANLPAKTGILEFDVEAQQLYRQLEAIDAIIQEANFTKKSTWPRSFPLEPGDFVGQTKTLAQFLLRRKTLKERSSRLVAYLAVIPATEAVSRSRVNDELDSLVITYPLVSQEEARRTYNQTQMALREIDNHIQQANWSIEVKVDGWIKSGFMIDQEASQTGQEGTAQGQVVQTPPPPSLTPGIAPMVAPPLAPAKSSRSRAAAAAPVVPALTPVAPPLAPAAPAPGASGVFIPPNFDEDDGDETLGPTGPTWG